jgi:hypothetical protein
MIGKLWTAEDCALFGWPALSRLRCPIRLQADVIAALKGAGPAKAEVAQP